MYANFTVEPLKSRAEQFVLENDRYLYLVFFKAVEKYCHTNRIIIGGDVGIAMLLEQPVNKNVFFWDLYCENAFVNAKNIADLLHDCASPHIDKRTVALQTNIKHKEFTISVNARQLFKIMGLYSTDKISIYDVINPSIIPSYFTQLTVKIMPAEMQLIKIYNDLYSPNQAPEWEGLLAVEEIVFRKLENERTKIVRGGRQTRLLDINKLILDKLRDCAVVVGDYALGALELDKYPERLQIICSMPIDEIIAKLGLKGLSHIKYQLNMPRDFRLEKYTVYQRGRETVALFDVYNSTAYELVPFTPGPFKIGAPYVLMRFLFINIWSLRVLNSSGKNAGIKNKINVQLTQAKRLRQYITKMNKQDLFQLTNYAGIYIDEKVAKKQLIREIGDRFSTYYPEKLSDE